MAKCVNCGLVNFDTAEKCLRCASALKGSAVPGAVSSEMDLGREPTRSQALPYRPAPQNEHELADHTGENRQLGVLFVIVGLLFACGPWLVLALFERYPIKTTGMAIALGVPFILVGIVTSFDPPRTPLAAEENKTRTGILLLVGFVFSAVEAYAFLRYTGAI